MEATEYSNHFFQRLVIDSFEALPIRNDLREDVFEISVHMIRIQAAAGNLTGRPAPEGIHRDGYHFGSIHLMRRENLTGARNNIYDLNKKLIDHKLLEQPMDSIYFDDAAIFHGVSPFKQKKLNLKATRDMLILLYQPLSESPQKKCKEVQFLCSY